MNDSHSVSDAIVFPRLVGMVHLLPLPGSPGYGGSRQEILERAVADAHVLVAAGFDAILIENYGDTPFHKEEVETHVIADMTAIAVELRRSVSIPFGVQVLRNDARAALSVAAAAGAVFIRVNVHTGAMLTDQGIIEGKAADTLRSRARLDATVRVFADVMVKHAIPFPGLTIESAARDAVYRGHADALIVSGISTGEQTNLRDIAKVKSAVSVPVYVGSGANTENVAEMLRGADGIIVGTSIKKNQLTTAPVDAVLAENFVKASR